MTNQGCSVFPIADLPVVLDEAVDDENYLNCTFTRFAKEPTCDFICSLYSRNGNC